MQVQASIPTLMVTNSSLAGSYPPPVPQLLQFPERRRTTRLKPSDERTCYRPGEEPYSLFVPELADQLHLLFNHDVNEPTYIFDGSLDGTNMNVYATLLVHFCACSSHSLHDVSEAIDIAHCQDRTHEFGPLGLRNAERVIVYYVPDAVPRGV